MKFSSAIGQRMSIHRCYLAGINETSTIFRARPLRFQRRLRFPAKTEKTSCSSSSSGRVLLLRSAGLHFTSLSDPRGTLPPFISKRPALIHFQSPEVHRGRDYFLASRHLLLRLVKPAPETYWTSPADVRLLPCLHFCRCDSAGFSADLLC